MSQKIWYAGSNQECFNLGPFDSRDEAISEGRENYGEDHRFFIGVRGEYKPFKRDFIDELLESEADAVNDECGPEASDNWPPPVKSSAEAQEANEQIRAILMKLCGECSMFPIRNLEEIPPVASSAEGSDVA